MKNIFETEYLDYNLKVHNNLILRIRLLVYRFEIDSLHFKSWVIAGLV